MGVCLIVVVDVLRGLTADGVGEMSEIETAVVVDDVINQPPRFLQQK